MYQALSSGIAFVAGFSVMCLELLAARIVAPVMGNSVIVWTNIIGIILLALALGAWAGGELADRKRPVTIVTAVFVCAGLWAVFLALCGRLALTFINALPLEVAIPLSSLALFAPPCFLLGAVSPSLMRASLHDMAHAGHVAGKISAMGTFGSLVGTYLTAYAFLPHFPVSRLLFGLAVLLLGTALLLAQRRRVKGASLLVAYAGLAVDPTAFERAMWHEVQYPSTYGHVAVREGDLWDAPARMLIIGAGLHAAATPTRPERSVLSYAKALEAMVDVLPQPKRMLLIGGGGYHVAASYAKAYPEAEIEVVEIDPAVEAAADDAFGTLDASNVHAVIDDARSAVAAVDAGRYDVLVSDAFGSDHAIPWYLMTKESTADQVRAMSPNGIYLANAILPGVMDGERGRLVAGIGATLRSGFAWMFAVSVHPGPMSQNVIIVAGNGPELDRSRVLTAIRARVPEAEMYEFPAGGEVWTDDHGTADYQAAASYAEERWAMR